MTGDNSLSLLIARQGYTQSAVARQLQVHESLVHLWGSGKRSIPRSRRDSIAQVLGVSVAELMGGVDPSVKCSECDEPLRKTKVRTSTRCKKCIMRQLWRDGHFDKAGRRRADRWLPEDDGQLRAMAGRMTAAEIARKIGRSKFAVHFRASEMGVSLQIEYWTQQRICQLFGARDSTVAPHWFATGLIRATRLPTEGRSRYGYWRVEEADLEAFILDCPWAYNAQRMFPQSHRLVRMALRVQRRDPWVTASEAAAYLGTCRNVVPRWCHAGAIPFKRRHVAGVRGGVGGSIVIRQADLPAAREEIQRRRANRYKLRETMRIRRAA